MKASETIKEMQKLIDIYGDFKVKVFVNGYDPVNDWYIIYTEIPGISILTEKSEEQNTKLIIEKIAFLEKMNDNLLNELIKIQKYYENN